MSNSFLQVAICFSKKLITFSKIQFIISLIPKNKPAGTKKDRHALFKRMSVFIQRYVSVSLLFYFLLIIAFIFLKDRIFLNMRKLILFYLCKKKEG